MPSRSARFLRCPLSSSVRLATLRLPAGTIRQRARTRSTLPPQAILSEIEQHSHLMADLEYLCDMIGPRLTGSAKMDQASRWTRDKFQEYGLQNVHLEGFKIARAWTRGDATGRIVAPPNSACSSSRPAGRHRPAGRSGVRWFIPGARQDRGPRRLSGQAEGGRGSSPNPSRSTCRHTGWPMCRPVRRTRTRSTPPRSTPFRRPSRT